MMYEDKLLAYCLEKRRKRLKGEPDERMSKSKKPKKCIGCDFYEDDKVSDDGDNVEGWGCCCPTECPQEPK